MSRRDRSDAVPPARVGEVLRAFGRLGLTAFGGPVAHLGYFREEFVHRRGWLDEAQFAQLLAVCQFLPGPASSQMGLAIGLFRAGWAGAAVAFVAFTLPSAVLLFAFALLGPMLDGGAGAAGVHGLKLVAVAVVAHALLGMARQLTPDLPRALIAVAAAALVVFGGDAWLQLLGIVLGGLLGPLLCRRATVPEAGVFRTRYGRRTAIVCLSLFAAGLAAALLLGPGAGPGVSGLAATFYQAGALVFGGGHVVLPLLEQSVVEPGWVGADRFLAGYGAAQAVPGPMFSLAAFLGAEASGSLPAAAGAAIALLAVFLPGFLLLLGILPLWASLLRHPSAARAVAGVNAAVVGLLAAAFYDPVLSSGVRGPLDLVVAAAGFALLAFARRSPLWVVLWCVLASVVMQTASV